MNDLEKRIEALEDGLIDLSTSITKQMDLITAITTSLTNITGDNKMKKLIELRSELSVPKAQKNNFGNYNYRSCEDILEAVKPLLKKHGLFMTITDDLVNVGDRNYVKATVTVSDGDNTITACGFAREAETKKGMSDDQITGSASSYARKYALNAMFLIDDTKDADTDEQHRQTNKPEPKKEKSFDRQKAIDGIEDYMQKNGIPMDTRESARESFNHAKTREDFEAIYRNIMGGK